MIRTIIILYVAVSLLPTTTALAIPVAPLDEARAEYNPTTGVIRVSVNSVTYWWVEHVGFNSMTGAPPSGLPATNGLLIDNDTRIGEANHPDLPMTYNVDLGAVASIGIPNDGSLKIIWNPDLSGSIALPIEFIPEPTTAILATLGLTLLVSQRRR